MAATPEEFLQQGAFLAEPFSPSVFLDLPPTPRDDGDGDDRASSDDLVLPFISRMLMEEDIDDQFFYQHPDGHTALLTAQEPFAQILSDASETAALSSSDSDNTNTLPAAGGEQGALDSAFFSGQNGGSTDMFNLAFLKGMEEAKKFLPSNISLLIDLKATSGEHLPRDTQAEEEVAVHGNGTPMFQGSGNGRGRKNRHNGDDLEAETGRNQKLMAPEPEQTGEMVDDMIVNGYDLCLAELQGLRIAVDSEAEKNTTKGKRGKQGSNGVGVVDLRTLLIHCAEAVATDDRRSATELLRQIKQNSSPKGDATQRLAHCFAEGLETRLAGTGSQVYRSLMAKRTSVMELLKAYKLYLEACCFKMMAFKFSCLTIHKAIAGREKVHIVEYGVQYGVQWPALMRLLATREGGPPAVRITGIDLPQPGFRPAARIEETGRRLHCCARQFGVPFKFHSIAARWETVRIDDLEIDPDEVLIVNSLIDFGNLMDEGIPAGSPSPRDVVLKNIQKMRPDAFILYVKNGSYSAPFFVTRFREAMFYYSAMFDMLDATAPRDSDQRFFVERVFFGRSALNIIACEGWDRVERPETYKQWQVRNHRAGLRQLPLDADIVKVVKEKVKNHYHKDFVIDLDYQWLLQGWKGRVLYAMSTWIADDATSKF